jgi:hypothetical protein
MITIAAEFITAWPVLKRATISYFLLVWEWSDGQMKNRFTIISETVSLLHRT